MPPVLFAEPTARPLSYSQGVVGRSRTEFASRVVNLILAVVVIILLAPLLIVIAVAIKLTSRGPVVYAQTRVGIDRRTCRVRALYDRRTTDVGGSVFTMYKFRTMVVDAERATGPVWAAPRDPRTTPVGRLLRAIRVDELLQLINVIKGDMNLVGPRPERPTMVTRFRAVIPEYVLRHRTRPGITGWAQINHAYDASLDDVRMKVSYDLEYLRRRSIVEDFRILIKTVPVMLFKRGGW